MMRGRGFQVTFVLAMLGAAQWVAGNRPLEGQASVEQGSLNLSVTCVPPGSFQMGSTSGDRDERPVHTVTLSQGFCLGTFEVTQRQWGAVMGNTVADQLEQARRDGGPDWDLRGVGPNHPMYLVSWNEVHQFLTRLNARDPEFAYRLPTEAEWEYAARAGATSEYHFGNDTTELAEYAWYLGSADYRTHPVGQRRPNAWGLHDMHGNVWEWVQDRCRSYSRRAMVDPTGPGSGVDRSMRGGSWGNPARSQRAAHRTCNSPASRSRGLGFRLVRERH